MMVMSRDEILNRLVTVRALLKRPNISKREREQAQQRCAELEEELKRLNERTTEPLEPEKVQMHIEKIREILKPEKARK